MSDGARKILILFSICLNVGFLVFAGYALLRPGISPEKERLHSSRPPYVRLLEQLDLEPALETEVKGIVQGFMEDMGRLRDRSMAEKLAYMDRLAQPGEIDRAWLDKKGEAILALEMERERARFEHFIRIRAKLPPDRVPVFFGAISDKIKEHMRSGPGS